MNVLDDIVNLKGIGPKMKEQLNKCGIFTIYDLLLYFPRRYENVESEKTLSEIADGDKVILSGELKSLYERRNGARLITSGTFEGADGNFEVYWFNQRYIKNTFIKGRVYTLVGKAKILRGKVSLSNPTIFKDDGEKKKIMPVYSLTAGVSNSFITKTIKGLLETININENLPLSIIEKYKFCSLNGALLSIHFPIDNKELESAIRRLKFQELFNYSLKILLLKEYIKEKEAGTAYKISKRLVDLKNLLPYELTNAQAKAVKQILTDEKKDYPMNRLLQGDVGSGKTIVSIIAAFNVVDNGKQACIMAPTEILATQHLGEFKKLLEPLGVKIELLVGAKTAKQKREIKERLYNGEIDILIGTHALIEDDVEFKDLGLIVADEQHRFGVAQRNKLYKKAKSADVLVMTATPIPRTLSLYIYGDLDVSVIDELPPGRMKIDTKYFPKEKRDSCYKFLRKSLKEGRQGYIVCPLIEEGDGEGELTSVEKVYEEVSNKYLKDYKIEILHGKMKGREKEEIMTRFKNKEVDVLISTTVIEVGINVPNANVMIIQDSERFGLSQLHQLRGRVGRGEYKSYCLLVGNCKSKVSRRRMEIMEESNDGFYISNEDMKLRGTGDLFGYRQSGEDGLIISDLIEDFDILKAANKEARLLIENAEGTDEEIKENILNNLEKYSSYIAFN